MEDKATPLPITFDPKVGKRSNSSENESKESIWNENTSLSSVRGRMTEMGIETTSGFGAMTSFKEGDCPRPA